MLPSCSSQVHDGCMQVVITGGTSGIGLAAAEALVRQGARVAIVARSREKAEAVKRRIGSVDVLMADLTSQREVRRLAEEIRTRYPRLDVLCNNAGAAFSRRQLSVDGIEMTWALNHLAPFLLTTLLLDVLKAPARIITTSSAAHRGARIPFDDLNAEHGYSGWRRYGQSKLANILMTAELARRLAGTGVTANCFHPGFVASGFNMNNGAFMRGAMGLMRPLQRSPQRGADTMVWLAGSPDVASVSGRYFADRKPRVPSPEARDMGAARRLWDASLAQLVQ
jgi:retinol dehydrogenase-14